MNIQQQLQTHILKKSLTQKKQSRIKQKLNKKQRQEINLDHSHLKTGKMQKTKHIQKKTFKTLIQKNKKIDVQIQDNTNAGTYVYQSQQYITILNRTKRYIVFDQKLLADGCKAISAYAKTKNQTNICIELTMQNDIQCNQTPIILRLPHQQQHTNSIIIVKNKQQIQQKLTNTTTQNIKILDLKQFINKYKADKKFKKQITKKNNKIFCDFNIFTHSKIVKKLIVQLIPVFPIDVKKIPYTLQQQINHYEDYIGLLLGSMYFVTRTGAEHRIYVENKDWKELAENIQSIAHQAVARLIQKNKIKGNKLLNLKIKSQTSVPIDIYNC